MMHIYKKTIYIVQINKSEKYINIWKIEPTFEPVDEFFECCQIQATFDFFHQLVFEKNFLKIIGGDEYDLLSLNYFVQTKDEMKTKCGFIEVGKSFLKDD